MRGRKAIDLGQRGLPLFSALDKQGLEVLRVGHRFLEGMACWNQAYWAGGEASPDSAGLTMLRIRLRGFGTETLEEAN